MDTAHCTDVSLPLPARPTVKEGIAPGSFRKGVPYFGVLIIRILLFAPCFRKPPSMLLRLGGFGKFGLSV